VDWIAGNESPKIQPSIQPAVALLHRQLGTRHRGEIRATPRPEDWLCAGRSEWLGCASKMATSPTRPTLRGITAHQWRSGIAAWLGWFFDGLDMHLYTLVAAPFVAHLLQVADLADSAVKEKSSWIQAAFMVGWALGGGIFGRLGDLLGRSRCLALTILTYATFTGMACFATQWWHLLIFRFVAALGIGGEWAIGSALLAETWPKCWRAWISAVLQMGVNLGILCACVTRVAMAAFPERYIFLVGVVPALMVYWIRRKVPETDEWQSARNAAGSHMPGIRDLFRREVRRTTLVTIVVCACSLTGWWAFIFWNPQHFRNLPELRGWPAADRERLVAGVFFLVVGVSIIGNFCAAWLARRIGYRNAILVFFGGFLGCFIGAYGVPRGYQALLLWVPWIGFFSGVFALFTMYLPPLFPVLLRTTGAGFCYNIGRIAAAVGTIVFGLLAVVGDFRLALLCDGLLFIPAFIAALWMPNVRDET